MDALVALAPRIGVDSAACVAHALNGLRRNAAVRLQAVVRGARARRRAAHHVVHLVVRWLDAKPGAGTACTRAMCNASELSLLAQLVVLRRVLHD
jgi:hypothetical protein